MNKNIRRSIVIAAGVSGAWALGSAVASADEQPAHSVSVPDRAVDAVEDTTPAGTGAVGAAAEQGAAGRVTHVLRVVPGAVAQEVTDTVHRTAQALRPHDTPPSEAASHVPHTPQGHGTTGSDGTAAHRAQPVHEVVDQAVGTAERVAHHAAAPVQNTTAEGTDAVRDAGTDLTDGVRGVAGAAGPSTGDGIDYLFGPLSAFAPELAATTGQPPAPAPAGSHQAAHADHEATGHQAPVPVRPLQQTVASQATAPRTFGAEQTAEPTADGTAARSLGGPAHLVPVVLQAVGDVLYIEAGIQADLLAGQLPDSVVPDTQRLLRNLAHGLGEVVGVHPDQVQGD